MQDVDNQWIKASKKAYPYRPWWWPKKPVDVGKIWLAALQDSKRTGGRNATDDSGPVSARCSIYPGGPGHGFSRSHDPRTAEPKVHSDRCRPARRLTKKRGRLSFRTKHFQLVPIRAYSIGCWLHIGRIREQAVHLAGNQQVLSTYRCSATASSKETVSRLPRVAADNLPNSMSRSSRQGLCGIRSGSDRGKRSYNSDLRQAARGCLFASYELHTESTWSRVGLLGICHKDSAISR